MISFFLKLLWLFRPFSWTGIPDTSVKNANQFCVTTVVVGLIILVIGLACHDPMAVTMAIWLLVPFTAGLLVTNFMYHWRQLDER